MKNLKAKLIENKGPFLIAGIQWFATTVLQFDRAFFTYGHETKILIMVKFLYLIFLTAAWCFGFDVYQKLKEGNTEYKRGLHVFSVYFVIMMAFLLILWPGTWAWDDIWTLNSISGYESLNPWQNIITGIYQDVMLQILPFPGGMILLQNVIVSLCVAFSVTKLERAYNIKRFGNSIADVILKILPFLLPPVILYQFSGYRMGLYVYLELVMLVLLISAIKDKKEWKWEYIFLFCFLTVVVAVWRTESFLYVPFVCILLLFVNKNILSNSKRIVCIILCVVGFLGMNAWQKHELGNSNYEIISLLGPCVELVRTADYERDAEELEAIDKVASLEVIHNNPRLGGGALYWGTDVVRDYTDEDYSNFLKAVVKLSLRYPQVVLAERWNTFITASGITGCAGMRIAESAMLFDENNENTVAEYYTSKGWIAHMPILKQTRKAFIYVLSGKKPDGTSINIIQRLIWNAIIPMIFLVYAWFKLLMQKKWYLWFVCTAVLMRVPIVVLTAPANSFMYVLPHYFLGYVYAVYKMLIYFSAKRVKVNE